MNKYLTLFLALLCLTAACHKGDDGDEPKGKSAAINEIMVIFSPGQLGDNGYADDVMEGVNLLSKVAQGTEELDSLDVSFLSPWNREDMMQGIIDWAGDAESRFVDGEYQYRLLVLTEAYMLPMVDAIKTKLRPTDEVLVLKTDENDIKTAAAKYNLGDRLHGLNISAASSIRRFCKFMDQQIQYRNEILGRSMNRNRVPLLRLYGKDYGYRDSIAETLAEVLGNTSEVVYLSLGNEGIEGLDEADGGMPVIKYAYMLADVWQYSYRMGGSGFMIVDLGTGNAGWDYNLMQRSIDDDTYITLYIDRADTPLPNSYCVQRMFGFALLSWCYEWMVKSPGEMPASITHSNDYLCSDNLDLNED